jgi:hypothetical protein
MANGVWSPAGDHRIPLHDQITLHRALQAPKRDAE